jgi:PAS domain-containing protein
MIEAATAEILLGTGHLAVSLVQPDGEILFENRAARDMLGLGSTVSKTITESLTIPNEWEDLIGKVKHQGTLADEPVLLQTSHGDAELFYVTAIPQFTKSGALDRLLCIWATRRGAVAPPLNSTDTGTLTEYTRDLEQVLEHRTYQNLLAAEQSEFARDALDVLPVGILLASADGQILYRNHAMSDTFGLRPADYPELDVAHVLDDQVCEAFAVVIAQATRRFLITTDPGGNPATVDLLPLIRTGAVQRVLFQFARSTGAEDKP